MISHPGHVEIDLEITTIVGYQDLHDCVRTQVSTSICTLAMSKLIWRLPYLWDTKIYVSVYLRKFLRPDALGDVEMDLEIAKNLRL